MILTNIKRIKFNAYTSSLALLAVGIGMLCGCGAKTTTSTLYDTPNWMSDGRIICNKLVMTSTQQLYGPGISESHSYITALTINGSNEVVKEENLFEGGGNEITCSPTGELIAYTNAYYLNGTYIDDGIVILDYNGNKSYVPNTSNVDYLDWSPDATKLVFSASRKLYVINRDGTGKTQIATSAEAVAWRVGEKIAYEDSVYNKIWLATSDGSTKEAAISTVSSLPQISHTDKIIFRGADNKIKSINISGTGEVELFSEYEQATLKLSFDGQKIAGGELGDPGIWVINIDGISYKKIR